MGGIGRIQGADATVILKSSTQILTSEAATHGGGFYFETTGSSTLDIQSAKITTVRANGKGGLAYFDGTTNTGKINGATTEISDVQKTTAVGAILSGGIFYMYGSTTNTIEFQTGAKITDVTTTSHGALFYMNGAS